MAGALEFLAPRMQVMLSSAAGRHPAAGVGRELGGCSGRARPLGEVAKRYISLKTGRFGFDFREALPYADQCVAAVLTKASPL